MGQDVSGARRQWGNIPGAERCGAGRRWGKISGAGGHGAEGSGAGSGSPYLDTPKQALSANSCTTYSYEATYTLKRSGAEKFDQNHFLVSCTRSIRLNFCISVQEGPTIPMHQIKHSEHIYIQVMKQHMP